jgi:hypothetical protein
MKCKIEYHTIISKFMHNISTELNDIFDKKQLPELVLSGLNKKGSSFLNFLFY